MSASPFVRQTKPEDMLCRVASNNGRQATIQNNHRGIQDWDREYVEFSGFFGTHGPHLFAAAPELFAALSLARERMIGSSPSIVKLRRLTDDALAKASQS